MLSFENHYYEPCPAFLLVAYSHKKQKTTPLSESHVYDMPEVGDIKVTVATGNGSQGWFTLNGQTVTGDVIAEASATTLFGSTTLPDYADSYLRQSSANLAQVEGTNDPIVIGQTNLPDVSYTGHVLRMRDHGAEYADGVFNSYQSGGNSSGSGGTASQIWAVDFNLKLNGGVTQVPIDINPKHVNVNYQVWLGTSN
jgi:hypothetical protein